VTDIEMPEMNGLELLHHLQHDETLRHLPVVVVSARKTEGERQESLHAGASAHLAKGEFDELTLLQTVQTCLGDHR
jgi:CheY-like chemotaxis protein